MQDTIGDEVARALEETGVDTAFGVISIHNMPILDALARRGRIRFVPARGEAGATSMADAYARVRGSLGVVITSTGTAAANAAGGLVEAQTAGSPVLHLTGQIDTPYLDKHKGFIHEAYDQPGMLSAVSKSFYRIKTPNSARATLSAAITDALGSPRGPVSVEIPIDVQAADSVGGQRAAPDTASTKTDESAVTKLADALSSAKRPVLWVGGGARHASQSVARFANLGFAVVSSVNGRGVLPEHHAQSLGSYGAIAPVEAFYASCDACLVVGSRLRSNETLKYTLKLPSPLYQIDMDRDAIGKNYAPQAAVVGDSDDVLNALADRLGNRIEVDKTFAADVRRARLDGQDEVMKSAGIYAPLIDALESTLPERFTWIRDITLSNSVWGNRRPSLSDSRQGVHALGGGIGLGVAMGIGAALGRPDARAVVLLGDGGLQLGLAELATACQEQANVTFLVMNDHGYGVIRNIQDAHYGGRRHYVDVVVPTLNELCQALELNYRRVAELSEVGPALGDAHRVSGPSMVEVDMTKIGPFATNFAGPPVRR